MKLTELPRFNWRDLPPTAMRRLPHVIENVAENWQARCRWNHEYLKSVAGDSRVRVRQVNGAPTNVYLRMNSGIIGFAEYLDWVVQVGEALDSRFSKDSTVANLMHQLSTSGLKQSYYLDIPLAALSDTLMSDVAIPQSCPRQPFSIQFWCGVLGSSPGLHFDVFPNCNVQVIGRKQFILFPPSECKKLYPMASAKSHCAFDPNSPDFDQFPLARSARGWKCILAAGDAIYIPPGWYHQVATLSSWAVNVNFWWARPLMQTVTTPVLRTVLIKRMVTHGRLKLSTAFRSIAGK